MCLFLIIVCQHVFAQSRVSGFIVDKDLKGVGQANVLLLKTADSSLVKGMITADDGSFAFENIDRGRYVITSTFSGYEQVYSDSFEIAEGKEKIDVGTISLPQQIAELKSVTVSGKKPLFQQLIDRTVINVENSITAAGISALDVLARSPGVVVNYQNNTIAMNGKNGVVIMINGKPSYMPVSAVVQMLQGMNASNIEKIELITTPPANFDAEGNAGYINIVLKTNNNVGTNGSFSLMIGYGQRFLTSQSLNFNHRKGKVNIYGDFSYRRPYNFPYVIGYRRVSNAGKITETATDTKRDVVEPNFNGRLGLDVQAGKKTVMGVLLTAYDNNYIMTAVNSSYVFTDGRRDSSIIIDNVESNHWRSFGSNFNVQHNINDNESLTFNFDYIHYRNSDPVEYDNHYFDAAGNFTRQQKTRSGKETPISIWVAAFDYTKKVSEKFGFSAGVKQTVSNYSNDVSFMTLNGASWVKDNSLSAVYKLDENYSAGYVSANVSVAKRTEAKLGLRYEYTNSNLETETEKNIVDRHYGRLFPSVFISHKSNENNSFNISFSRRITRPTFNDLAPFTYYADPNTLLTGNSALQPSISNSVKGEYMYKTYYFAVTYSKETNSIQAFQPKVDSVRNKQVLSAENIVSLKTLNASVSVPITVNNWWSMQYNFGATWQEANAVLKSGPLRVRKTNWSVNGNQRFTFPQNWSAEISGFFQSADLIGVVVRRPIGLVDVGVKKKLKDNRSSFQLSGTNLLHSMKLNNVTDVPRENLYTRVSLNFFYRAVRLTYTRNFGKEKLRESRSRSTGSEEERARVK
jgi:hypothetical protein